MTVKALHTAARRYLMGQADQIRRGEKSQQRVQDGGRSPGPDDVAGDAGVARRMLEYVERRSPADFQTVEELRRWLLNVGTRFQDDQRAAAATSGRGEHIQVTEWRVPTVPELKRARDERLAFVEYIRGLHEEHLRHVAPLPYRRVLTEQQSARWRAALAERWDAHPREHYWYPLHPDPLPPDLLALQHRTFLLEVDPVAFRSLFFRRGLTRVLQFVENHIFQRDYELDIEWVVPGGPEVFWTSRELDWVVYTSHESSITFAGDWLIEGIKEIWPNWQQRIYTDWRYASNMEQDVWETSPWFLKMNAVE